MHSSLKHLRVLMVLKFMSEGSVANKSQIMQAQNGINQI